RVLLVVGEQGVQRLEVVGLVDLVDLVRLPVGQPDPDAVVGHEHRQVDGRLGGDRLGVAPQAAGLDAELRVARPHRGHQEECGEPRHRIEYGDQVDVPVPRAPAIFAVCAFAGVDCAGHGYACAPFFIAWRWLTTKFITWTVTSLMSSLSAWLLPFRNA